MESTDNPRLKRLIQVALSFVGTSETSDNEGSLIEEFQKSVDGRAAREPWCMAFIQFCIKKVEEETQFESPVYKGESCLEVWEKSPQMLRIDKPIPGAIMIWKVESKENPRAGHAEIVIPSYWPDGKFIDTIGGNTSAPGNEFQGVHVKTRSLTGTGKMKPLGWLIPWV